MVTRTQCTGPVKFAGPPPDKHVMSARASRIHIPSAMKHSGTPRPLLHRWRLVPALALGLASTALHAQTQELRLGGTGTALGTMQVLAQAYQKTRPDLRLTIYPSMGSKGGIKAVAAGTLQIGLSSRPPTPEEQTLGVSSVEYGRTPFVFAVAATSPVDSISTDELVSMYAGQQTQWPGGTRIRLVMRPNGDADSDMVKAMSPAMADAVVAAEQRKGQVMATTDQEAADAIEKVPGALGATTLAQILSEKRPFKALRLNGIPPSIRTLADGSYPMFKTLYFVTGPRSGPAAREFIAFVQSPAGRGLMQQLGHQVK